MTDKTQPDDDSYIVRVKAVVMTRDDSSGGWLPQEGGCLCRVGVCKVLSADLLGRSSFLICGERLKDKEVILECFLKKDLIYTKATPTFHHWKVDNQKWGLTFLSSADARAFDRGVRRAIEDLTEGSTTSSSTIQNEAELGDDDVFTNATDSSSNSSQKKELPMETLAPLCLCEARQHHCILGHIYDQRRPLDHYLLNQSMPVFPLHVSCRVEDEEIVRINPRERAWLTGYEDYRHPTTTREKHIRPENAYVHFAKSLTPKQDYIYPYPIDFDAQLDRDSKSNRVDGIGSHRAVVTAQPRALQPKGRQRKEEGERSRCVYCQDMFNHEENGRGRCHEAPDPVQTCIHRVSFMWCADSLLYHCMSDPEGDYSDPCSCDTSDERFCLRWLALVMLSMLAPCMCCYGPLRVCYRCGVACHCCGGKHKPVG